MAEPPKKKSAEPESVTPPVNKSINKSVDKKNEEEQFEYDEEYYDEEQEAKPTEVADNLDKSGAKYKEQSKRPESRTKKQTS